MVSSIEVFDPDRMAHVRSVPLPNGLGSSTWVEERDGAWWVTFAHYDRAAGLLYSIQRSTREVLVSRMPE